MPKRRASLWPGIPTRSRSGVLVCDWRASIKLQEQILIRSLDRSRLVVGKLWEFRGARTLRKMALVLAEKSHHKIERRIRHFDKGFDLSTCLIIATQIVN